MVLGHIPVTFPGPNVRMTIRPEDELAGHRHGYDMSGAVARKHLSNQVQVKEFAEPGSGGKES